MAEPHLWLREELEPAVIGNMGNNRWSASEPLGSQELAFGWAGHPPFWQGVRVRTEQGMGCV